MPPLGPGWLRVCAVVGVILMHGSRMEDGEGVLDGWMSG